MIKINYISRFIFVYFIAGKMQVVTVIPEVSDSDRKFIFGTVSLKMV